MEPKLHSRGEISWHTSPTSLWSWSLGLGGSHSPEEPVSFPSPSPSKSKVQRSTLLHTKGLTTSKQNWPRGVFLTQARCCICPPLCAAWLCSRHNLNISAMTSSQCLAERVSSKGVTQLESWALSRICYPLKFLEGHPVLIYVTSDKCC